MSVTSHFEERYQQGDLPWDHELPDENLIELVTNTPLAPCRTLDIGCGLGDNVIWLAQQGFQVTGCDISPTAIEGAKARAEAVGVQCDLVALDFLKEEVTGAPFEFIVDRGCLHSVDAGEEREKFAYQVAVYLETGWLWLTLTGNADAPPSATGPPRLTARELVKIVEPHFEILSLTAGHFGSDQAEPPPAWICLMRRRGQA